MKMEKKFNKYGNEESVRKGFSKTDLNSGTTWREWKKKKKEDYKQWKETKMLNKIKKTEDQHKPLEDSLTTHYSDYTISIAVPGSILDNAQTPQLKAYLAGQIARAAAVFRVNEVIVFSETPLENVDSAEEETKLYKKQGCLQLVRILQYLECPQYLRKFFFPMHKDLEHAGLLNPLNIPSHLAIDEESEYREGIVLDKPVKPGRGSYVYIGLRESAIIDKVLESHVRVTVKLDKEQHSKRHLKGLAVPPSAPWRKSGIYWGYRVRLARGLNAVFSESPYKEGYDLKIGTSDKGQNHTSVDIPTFKHLLVVFGGLRGMEGCMEDESIEAGDPSELFHHYLNTCPSQGSKTIRTEEAILITLSILTSKFSYTQVSS